MAQVYSDDAGLIGVDTNAPRQQQPEDGTTRWPLILNLIYPHKPSHLGPRIISLLNPPVYTQLGYARKMAEHFSDPVKEKIT